MITAAVVLMTMMINLSTKIVSEVVFDGNIGNIKSKSIIYLGIATTLLIFLYLYDNKMMMFSNLAIVDYLINIVLIIGCYFTITTIFMYIYISYIVK